MSALAAPVLLVGGWLLAQSVRPGFDAVIFTISDLARTGAPHRWIMTTALAGLGVAHLVTAAGLPMLRPASRVVLALAGAATVLVAAFPQPVEGSSSVHGAVATAAFVLLALWPVTTASSRVGGACRPTVALAVTLLSTALLLGFFVRIDGATAGAWERAVAAEQALWPLAVVVSLRVVDGGRDDRIAG